MLTLLAPCPHAAPPSAPPPRTLTCHYTTLHYSVAPRTLASASCSFSTGMLVHVRCIIVSTPTCAGSSVTGTAAAALTA
jgi:hypothetical protein